MSARSGARGRTRVRAAGGSARSTVLCATAAAAAICWQSGAENALRTEVLQLNEARMSLASDAADAAEAPSGGSSTSQAADEALAAAQETLRSAADARSQSTWAALACVAAAACAAVAGLALYLHRSIVAPFLRLDAFAEEVARGNLDAPLAYERANPFGSFAWAFDHLRVELARSRAAEAEADEAYKTALASLSHDLRTPLAALRAHAEALEMGLARTPEERAAYERLIQEKCDEAAALVEDLLSHALADMGRIQVACEAQDAAPILRACVEGFSSAVPLSCAQVDAARVSVDAKRLAQAVDNLLANAAKHAPGARVEVSGVRTAEAYRITVRDFGPGMAPEDLPFAQMRFFRGANAKEVPGAGLGLFISAHLAERMGGRLMVENAEPGLRAVIELPLLLMTS